MTSTLGRHFAEALAVKDAKRIGELLDPQVDFRGLTPNRAWEASGAGDVTALLFGDWFEESDHLDQLVEVETTEMADRERVSYRLRGHNADGDFLVEQMAYYAEQDGRIVWLRVLCSGFRPG